MIHLGWLLDFLLSFVRSRLLLLLFFIFVFIGTSLTVSGNK